MYEVGDKLKSARIKKGYSLDDMQQITKIQKRYLSAIEEGNLEILPGDFYVRAFIKQYGDTVGLDGDELVWEFQESEQARQRPANQASESRVDYSRTDQNSSDEGGVMATLKDSGPVFLVIGVIIAIIIAIYLATTQLNYGGNMINESENPERIEDQVANQQTEQVDQDSGSQEEEAFSQTIELVELDMPNIFMTVAGQHPENQELAVRVEDGESWINFNIDGESVDSGTLEDGESVVQEFAGDTNQVIVTLGNASSAEVQLNGQEVETSNIDEDQELFDTQYIVFDFE